MAKTFFLAINMDSNNDNFEEVITISNKHGEVLPVFTLEKLVKIEGFDQIEASEVSFKDIKDILKANKEIKEVQITNSNRTYFKNREDYFKKSSSKEKSTNKTVVVDFPQEILDAFSEKAAKIKGLSKAYIALDGDKKVLVVDLESKSDYPAFNKAIAKVARQFMFKHELLKAWTSLQLKQLKDFDESELKKLKPFYEKK